MTEPNPHDKPVVAHPPKERAILLYDGDCHFCRRWVAAWERETGGAVEYAPFQERGGQFPEISEEASRGAVHLVQTDGSVSAGADAVMTALQGAQPVRSWIYRHVPWVQPGLRAAYRFIAKRRVLFSRLSGLWWGRRLAPATYHGSRSLFLKGVALVYLVAFWSVWLQVSGLVGSHGILPVTPYLDAIASQLGSERLMYFPTVCWLSSSDAMLHALCVSGMLASCLVLAGVMVPLALTWQWAAYLSLCVVSRVFLGYQWDNLLLEVGLLAIFFAPWQIRPARALEARPSRLFHGLLLWLLFRLMLGSGLVKLASGDPAWWPKLTAMSVHYQTQPLPAWPAWFMHHLPDTVNRLSTGMTLVMELVLPFLIFAPRSLRLVGCMAFVLLQGMILSTGNYTFFNGLTLLLCLLLLDDSVLPSWLVKPFQVGRPRDSRRWTRWPGAIVGIPLAIVIILLSTSTLLHQTTRCLARFGKAKPHVSSALVNSLQARAQGFRSVNGYGLFAVMTKSRPEIVVQGSMDGRTWKTYGFKHKPGDVMRRPDFVAPHQPRLDWQLWFAALRGMGNPQTRSWFVPFMVHLLQGTPQVLALIDENPFAERPPRHVRALVYDYQFTTPLQRRETGAWWTRGEPRLFCPPLSVETQREPQP